SPLLSRARVFVLDELTDGEMKRIIARTGIKIAVKEMDWLVAMANGDARQAIGLLESTAKLYQILTIDNFKTALQSRFLRFDKQGEEFYNVISAFIKSMRASDVDAALYYLARMVEAGQDPLYIARRMVVFASEDVGMAQPTALVVANEVFRACETIGYPECQINLAHGTVYLASAKKDRGAYEAYFRAVEDVKRFGNLPTPLKIRNPVTKLMKELKYGEGYDLPANATHNALQAGKYTKESLLPEKLKGKKYFKP
ncbi:MAG: AAA ATPase central domain protein, partial [Microgenomates group bacterium GW2011_GWC1_37_8]